MEIIERITYMEALYDQARETGHVPQALIDYYESGQWLKDYEVDERGQLPRNLKRGVLSQDGLWELLQK